MAHSQKNCPQILKVYIYPIWRRPICSFTHEGNCVSFSVHYVCNFHPRFIWLTFFSLSMNKALCLQGMEQLSWLNYQPVFISCLTPKILLPLPWAKCQVLTETILQDLSELFITPIEWVWTSSVQLSLI